MNEPVVDLLRRAADLQREGRSAVLCLLVQARGSTPQSAGALMLIDDAANMHGTIGGGCVEAEVRREALRMINESSSGVLRFKLDHDYGWDDGLICGGTIELAVAAPPDIETLDRIVDDLTHRRPTHLDLLVSTDAGDARYRLDLPPRERLYIAGAGHVGQALARQGLLLEFDVTIFDDRADLLARFAPPGVRTDTGSIAERLRAAPIDGETYCVIVTRGHRHDEQALRAVVDRGAKYLGMIGSRRKVKLIFDDLIERGVRPEALEVVHAPIGLDVNAVSVEEIGISIAAQLVQTRRSERRSSVSGPHLDDPNHNQRPDACSVTTGARI
jgi:xanthine dehydrogenase accessory factor